MTPDDLRAQVLALAALLPSRERATGVRFAPYRGTGERTHRKGWCTAALATDAAGASWRYIAIKRMQCHKAA